MTVVTLTTGLVVGNFSSPHEFKFTDGTVLPACSPERAKALELDTEEVETPSRDGRWTDIDIKFVMTDVVAGELLDAMASGVDVVLVPLPVMTAIKQDRRFEAMVQYGTHPFRVIRVADRVTKAVHTDRFCR